MISSRPSRPRPSEDSDHLYIPPVGRKAKSGSFASAKRHKLLLPSKIVLDLVRRYQSFPRHISCQRGFLTRAAISQSRRVAVFKDGSAGSVPTPVSISHRAANFSTAPSSAVLIRSKKSIRLRVSRHTSSSARTDASRERRDKRD